MFNPKKSTNQDSNPNKDEQKIELEMKTMKNDLKNLPSQKESFFVKDDKEKKPPINKEGENKPVSSPFATQPNPASSSDPQKKGPLSKQFLSEEELKKHNSSPSNLPFKKTEKENPKRESENNLAKNYSTQKKTPAPFSKPIKTTPLIKKEAPKVNIDKKKTKTVNWKLLTVTIVIFLFAIGSGAYYYLSIVNKGSTVSSPNLNESKPIEITTPEVEEVEVAETPSISPALLEAEIIEMTEDQNLKQTLAEFKLEIEQGEENGVFYQVSRSGEILDATQLLQELEINIPGINEGAKEAWVYVQSNSSGETKKSLIINSNLSFVEIKNTIFPIEKSLPSFLKNLYSPVLEINNEEVVFQVSEVDERFRFFNIPEGNPAKSVDWGVINISKDSVENNLIIFSTSKEMTEKFVESI